MKIYYPVFYYEQFGKNITVCSDPLNQQSLIGFFAKIGGNP